MSPLLMPIWDGATVYNESVLPLARRDGSVPAITLLYPAEEIISVKSATLEKEYLPGRDYILQDGALVIPPETTIPVMAYEDYYPAEDDGKTFPHTDGGFIRFSEGDYLHCRQLAVTYRHSALWREPVPQDKSYLLPRTSYLLRKGKINILIFGDSISTGANASAFTDTPPHQKAWFDLMAEGLEARFGCEIDMTNTSVGGTVSAWGAETARERGADKRPDIAIIGFGMNDGSLKVAPEDYIAHLNTIMETISSVNPDCEYVLIATTLANPEVKGFVGRQEEYLSPMLALEKEGVCVADMTTMHKSLLSRKAFHDITGNNVNHPNDFLSRVYAQVLLRTLGGV